MAQINVKTAKYNALRLTAKSLGITSLGANPTKAELVKAIEKIYRRSDIKSRKEKALLKVNVEETLSKTADELNTPVDIRVAFLQERFRSLIATKFADKEEVKSLIEASEEVKALGHVVAAQAGQISHALQIIEEYITVEAEEVINELPSEPKSWVDTISAEDLVNDINRD